MENWVKIINKQFTKVETQLANKYMKRSSTSISKEKYKLKQTPKHKIPLYSHHIGRYFKILDNTNCW